MYEPLKCPECKSTNIFFQAEKDEYECLSCGYKWPKGKPPEVVEVEKEKLVLEPRIFETEEEFHAWLEREGLTAEYGGLFKNDECVATYFKTAKGIEVVPEDTGTWLIRDKTLVEVEGKVEEPLELPEEVSEQKSNEKQI